MKSFRTALLALSSVLFVAGCMAHETHEERLALYQAHAGAPVKHIRYYNPIGWEEIDDEHILLTMRPKEVWLMRLSGPCLGYNTGSPILGISSQIGYVSSKFDRITTGNPPLSCRIEEIRPVDTTAVRAASKAQASGT